jgi:hypothetical protein
VLYVTFRDLGGWRSLFRQKNKLEDLEQESELVCGLCKKPKPAVKKSNTETKQSENPATGPISSLLGCLLLMYMGMLTFYSQIQYKSFTGGKGNWAWMNSIVAVLPYSAMFYCGMRVVKLADMEKERVYQMMAKG